MIHGLFVLSGTVSNYRYHLITFACRIEGWIDGQIKQALIDVLNQGVIRRLNWKECFKSVGICSKV